jgi:hypothetical protein
MKKRDAIRRAKPFDIAAFIVDTLNNAAKDSFGNDVRAELRCLVDLWIESGPNTAKLMHNHPGIIPETVECPLVANGGGLAVNFVPAVGAVKKASPAGHALALFLQLLTAENYERVSGPCKCGCGQFFIRKGRYGQEYIQGHASRKSASESMRRKQAEKRAPKVRAVNRALAKYKGPREHGDWRVFVEGETNFAVSIRKLTEWAAKGWIQEPKMGRR